MPNNHSTHYASYSMALFKMSNRWLKVGLVAFVLAALLIQGCATPPPLPEPDIKQDNVVVKETPRGVLFSAEAGVLFDTGKYEIKEGSERFLKQLASFMAKRSRNQAVVEGHTDNVGPVAYNQKLSEQRALAVKNVMVKYGVAADSIEVVGYGMTRPLTDNDSDMGRQTNRRTDIVLLGETIKSLGGAGAVRDIIGNKSNP